MRPSTSTRRPGASERPSRTSRRRRAKGRAIPSLRMWPYRRCSREADIARSGFRDTWIVTEIVTEGSGWYEQPADRAELDVSFTAVARTRTDAVRELGRRMSAAEPALARPGLQVRHRRMRVHNEWRGNKIVGCRAGEDLALLVTAV